MTHLLSYPHYAPDARNLRSFLLFYERLSTIVPHVDQRGVRERDSWAEISDISKGTALGFFDPSYRYLGWFNQKASKREFKKLAAQTRKTKAVRDLTNGLEVDDDGKLIQRQNRDVEQQLLAQGWNYLAAQKFPDDLLKKLLKIQLAFRTDPINPEQNPILIEPRLGNFILSRLARQVAEEENVSPVATLKRQTDDFLLDGEMTKRKRRAELLAVSLDVSLPEGLEELRIGDFWGIRNEFSRARQEMGTMMDDLAVNLDLDSEKSLRRFRERVEDKRSDIETRVRNAQQTINHKNTINMAIDIFVGVSTSGLGAAIGDIQGAVIGAGISPVVSKYGKKVSLRKYDDDIESISQLAVMRTKLTKQIRKERYQRPFYFL